MKLISLFMLFISAPVWAGPTLLALPDNPMSQGQFKYAKVETGKMTDRLREELSRRFGEAVYNKAESSFLVSYFQMDAQDNGEKKSLNELEKAKEAYFNLKLDESHAFLESLLSNPSASTIVEAYLLKGLVESAEGHIEEAKAAFRETHRLDDRRVLESRYFPPKVIKLYEQIKNEPYPKASLKIDSNPIGTEVWLNGVLIGLAPQKFEVAAGKHWIVLKANHYRTLSRAVTLKAGETISWKETLSWVRPGELRELGKNGDSTFLDADHYLDTIIRLGIKVGAAKVALFSVLKDQGQFIVETRIIDTELKTLHKTHRYVVPEEMTLERDSADLSRRIVDQLQEQLAFNLKSNPDRYVENRFHGDIVLVGNRRKYFFESPWFWGLVGAAGLGVGLGIGLAGSSSASTGILGITFQ